MNPTDANEARLRLASVGVAHMKCLNQGVDLAPVHVIAGPVGSGKTTLLNAIELGLAAEVSDPHAPDKPARRNLDIFRLATDGSDEMGVALVFDDDRDLMRIWRRKDTAKGPSVSGELSFTGQSAAAARKISDGERELREWLRASPFGLNVRHLPSMTVSKRRELILDMLAGGVGPDDRPLAEWLYEAATGCGKAEAADHGRLGEIVDAMVGRTDAARPVLDRLRSVEGAARDEARRHKEGLAGVEKALAQLGAADAEAVDTARIPEIATEIKGLDTEIGRLNTEMGIAETAGRHAARLRPEIDRLAAFLKVAGRCKGERDEGEWQGCKGEGCTQCAGTGEASPDFIEGLLRALGASGRAHEVRAAEAAGRAETIRREILARHGVLEKLREAMSKCDSQMQQVGETGQGHCILSDEITCPLKPDDMVLALRNRATKLAVDSHNVEAEIAGLGRDRQAELAKEAEDKIVVEQGEAEINALEQDLESAKAEADARDKRVELERELGGIEIPATDMLKTALDAKWLRHNELTDMRNAAERAAGQAESQAKMNEEKARASRELRCAEAVLLAAGIKGLQGQILKERVGPLVGIVDEVLYEFDQGRHFWLDLVDARGNEACIFGQVKDGIRIPFEVSSGGEQMILCLAIAVAMMRLDRRATVRVLLLDNIEALDDLKPMSDSSQTPRHAVLQAANAAVHRGWVDNVIMAGVVSIPLLQDFVPSMVLDEELMGWTEL